MLVDLIVGNLGTEPLLPLVFRLEVEVGGKWIDLPCGSIRPGFTITWPNGTIRQFLNPSEDDLNQRLPTVANSASVRGCIAFVLPAEVAALGFDGLFKLKKRLVCVDVARRKRTTLLNEDFVGNANVITRVPASQ